MAEILSPTLPRLPLDTLLAVMGHLEWSDLLLLQQTCTDLDAASRERSVWLDLLVRYQATLEPRLHWPDRPLHFYDASELKQFVLKPFRVDHAWKYHVPLSQRSLSVENAFPLAAIELIRGGRWFLLGSDHGPGILYIDLESPDPRPRVLIPCPFAAIGLAALASFPYMDVDMDDNAPYLAFNVALITSGMEPMTDDISVSRAFREINPVQVWRVTAVPDAQGRVIDLKAEMLVSFSQHHGLGIASLSIRNHLLAYVAGGQTFIKDWTQAGVTPRVHRVIPTPLTSLMLFRDDWLLGSDSNSDFVYLYNIHAIPETNLEWVTNYDDDHSSKRISLPHFRCSAAFEFRDSTQFIFPPRFGTPFYSITSPVSDPCSLSVEELRPWSDDHENVEFGPEYATIITQQTSVSVLRYSLPGSSSETIVSPKTFEISPFGTRSFSDRSSGRIVIQTSAYVQGEFTIVDYFLLT